MILDRLSDGSLVFSGTWKDYVAEYRKATRAQDAVLPDGRPAVRRVNEDGEVSYVSIYPSIWSDIRPKLKEMRALSPPKKREHLCELCRSPMKVAREYEGAWTFSCDVCKSTEIHGKDHVGGVWGAGEKEQR